MKILSYYKQPQSISDWNPSNFDDNAITKRKIFNCEMCNTRCAILIIYEETAKQLFDEEKIQKISSGLYSYAVGRVKRKLRKVDFLDLCWFVLVIENGEQIEDLEGRLNLILKNCMAVIIAETKDNTAQILGYIENNYFAIIHEQRAVCCGNPIDWSQNYIGRNCRLLRQRQKET